MVDAGQHDAGLSAVEQRDRNRLLPGELVVGVVAHQCLMGDRFCERDLDVVETVVQVLGNIGDVLLQRLKRLLQRSAVGDHILLCTVAEHQLLRRA